MSFVGEQSSLGKPATAADNRQPTIFSHPGKRLVARSVVVQSAPVRSASGPSTPSSSKSASRRAVGQLGRGVAPRLEPQRCQP